jgi:hypothetical protein
MKGRDRIVLIALAVIVVLGAGWVLAVSPKRTQANKLASQVSEAQAQKSSAEQQLASARAAQTQYASAYAAIVNLGKAVPASEEVPSLIYQLSQASSGKHVDFASIASTTSNTGTPAAAASSSTGASAGSGATASAGFSQMPFTFIFNGSFFDLEHLFQQLNRFTMSSASGALQVSGRLLTIQGVRLAPASEASSTSAGTRQQKLSGTITATAYVLPAGQSVTGGATPSSPAGSPTPVSSSSSGSAPAPAAVVRATP